VGRVVLGVAIVHPMGDRELPPERESGLRRALVETALQTLARDVAGPTLFRTPALSDPRPR
jgi:hypothetical protein